MDELFGLGASVASGGVLGGVFGVLGAGLGRLVGVVEQRETYRQEKARWSHEEKLRELQLKASANEHAQELARVATQGSYDGLTASLAADAASAGASYRWVEAVRALVRPVLTPLLWLLYLVVFFRITGGPAARLLEPHVAGDLITDFVANVAFAATAATLWWFGDRAPRRPDSEQGDRRSL